MKPLRALSVTGVAGLAWIGSDFIALRDEFSSALMATVPAQAAMFLAVAPWVTSLQRGAGPMLPISKRAPMPPAPKATPTTIVETTQTSKIDWASNDQALVEGWSPVDLGAAVRSAAAWSTVYYSVDSAKRPVAQPKAGDLAGTAYWQLARGNRVAAVDYFSRALAQDSQDDRVNAWAQERDRLGRRWSASAYVFARSGGVDLAQSALLGGGQTGAALGYTLNPLASQPIALTARVAVAHRGFGIDAASGQAAIGLRWQPTSWFSLSGERLFASGNHAANGWSGRIAAGGASAYGRFILSGYGEAGFVDAAPFVGAQGFAGYRLPVDKLAVSVGAAVWAGAQNSNVSAGRIDVGPSLKVTWPNSRLPIDLVLDYRRQISGNAAPGSGVALTISAAY